MIDANEANSQILSSGEKLKIETVATAIEPEVLSQLIGEQPRETYWGDTSKREGTEYITDKKDRVKTMLLEVAHPHELTGESIKTRMLLLEGGKLYPRMLSELGFTDEQSAALIAKGVKIDVLMTNFEDAVTSADRATRIQQGLEPNDFGTPEVREDEDLQRKKVGKLLGGSIDEEDSERDRMSLMEQRVPVGDGQLDKGVTEIITEQADRIVLLLGHGGPDVNKDKVMGSYSKETGRGILLSDVVALYQKATKLNSDEKLCVLDCGCTGEAMVTVPTSLLESDVNFMLFAARGDISLRDNNGVYMVNKQDDRLTITTGKPNPTTVTLE